MHGDGLAGGDYVAVWPKKAYSIRKDGEVTLDCLVDVYGLAESCTVAA